MRNITCSRYDACLNKAAKEDSFELPCTSCPVYDNTNKEILYEIDAMIALIRAIFTVRWA